MGVAMALMMVLFLVFPMHGLHGTEARQPDVDVRPVQMVPGEEKNDTVRQVPDPNRQGEASSEPGRK